MELPIYQIVFYFFSVLLITASLWVVFSKSPVQSALFLVLAFFASAVLWMLIQAEFLSLVLIFVYVGAVMTLFLFVVMMLNIDTAVLRSGFTRFIPFAAVMLVVLVGLMVIALGPSHLLSGVILPTLTSSDFSHVQSMGQLLYTNYVYPLEITGAILVVAMISAIAVAHFGRRPNTKSQRVASQVSVTSEERLRLVNIRRDEK